MINKILSFLRIRLPLFYNFIKVCYWKINYFKASFLGSRIEENKWANRDLNKIRTSLNNLTHSHRKLLVEKISRFQPIISILEIGCSYGPNLYCLAKQFPQAELTGIDINPLSIQEGNKLLTKDGILNVKLICGKADELRQFQNQKFDIVLTDALLIFIGPDKIKKVIREMLKITRRALIFVEWHCENPVSDKDPFGLGIYHYGCWKRNYINLFNQFVPKERIHLTKIPKELWPSKDWEELGYIIEVLLDN